MNHVLITGGTGLVGSVLVKGFVEQGWSVTFTTRSDEKGKKLKESVSHCKSADINYRVVQFLSELDVENFLLSEKDCHFTHLINNARTLDGLELDKLGYANQTAFSLELFMSVTLPYLLTIGLLPTLKNVINVSSMYGVVPPAKSLYLDSYQSSPIQYGVAKAAQIHLAKELSVRFAANDIRVNTVSFGGIEGRVDHSFKERYAGLCPAGRMLKVSEVFGPVWFLASPLSTGMTGHNLIVDGGWSVW